MPSFDFTSPEGKKYTVDGPAGATKEQAWGILQAKLAPPKMGPKDVPDSPPAQGNSGQPDTNDSSALDIIRGVPGALRTMGQNTVAGLAGRATELVNPGAGVKVNEALSYQPSERGQETLRRFSKLMEPTKLEGLGPMFAPEMAATRPTGAAGAIKNSVEVDALKKIPGKVADIVTPKPSPEIAALAKKAEDMGIQLRPDMLADNRIAKFIGEALEQVPLSGSKAEQRQIAFNGALSKIIGAEGKEKRLTPLVFDKAMTASGEKIGQISKETPIRVDADMRRVLDERIAQVGKFETADVAKIVTNYVTELGEAANKNGGVIPGETFRKINSQIGRQVRSTSNGDLKNALYELQEDMHDALEKNIAGSARLAELKEARYQYAMGKIIEPLVATAKGGDISPSALMGAVTSDKAKKSMMARGRGGEIGDLARIGQAFLKEPPSSGSGERLGAYGLLTGGAVAEPHTAAGIVAAANLYNRLGPALTKRAINRRAADPVESAPWNAGGDVNDIVRRLSQ